MLLGEPQRTPYDLNFALLGIPVRIVPWFWVVALLLHGSSVPPGMTFIESFLLWAVAVLISIAVHELGHALAFRRFGISSHIVLYQFGGMAISDGQIWGAQGGRSLHPRQHIFVSAAGPAAGFVLAAIIIGLLVAAGKHVPMPFGFIAEMMPALDGDLLPPSADVFVWHMLWVNIGWGLVNLLPVYPLDGGQIARELFLMYGRREPIQRSLMLSTVAAGGLAVFGLLHERVFLALMFGFLAYSSYQALQAYNGRGGFGGGGRPW